MAFIKFLTRSTGVKIRRETLNSKIRNYFAKKVSTRHNYLFKKNTPTWNALLKRTIQAPTIKIFNKGLDDRLMSDGPFSWVHYNAKHMRLRMTWQELLTN